MGRAAAWQQVLTHLCWMLEMGLILTLELWFTTGLDKLRGLSLGSRSVYFPGTEAIPRDDPAGSAPACMSPCHRYSPAWKVQGSAQLQSHSSSWAGSTQPSAAADKGLCQQRHLCPARAGRDTAQGTHTAQGTQQPQQSSTYPWHSASSSSSLPHSPWHLPFPWEQRLVHL